MRSLQRAGSAMVATDARRIRCTERDARAATGLVFSGRGRNSYDTVSVSSIEVRCGGHAVEQVCHTRMSMQQASAIPCVWHLPLYTNLSRTSCRFGRFSTNQAPKPRFGSCQVQILSLGAYLLQNHTLRRLQRTHCISHPRSPWQRKVTSPTYRAFHYSQERDASMPGFAAQQEWPNQNLPKKLPKYSKVQRS